MRYLPLFLVFWMGGTRLIYAETGMQDPHLVLSNSPMAVSMQERRFRFSAELCYLFFSQPTVKSSGMGAGAEMQYGLAPRWAIGGGVGQAFSLQSFSPLLTQFHLYVALSLTGTQIANTEVVQFGQATLKENFPASHSGLTARMYVSQYFLNTSSALSPYQGFGLGLSYDWTMGAKTPVSFGIRGERINNGSTFYYPVTTFFRFGIWM